MRFIDTANNLNLDKCLEKVWDALDFGPRNRALAQLERRRELELEAETNSVLNDHVEASFYLGWMARKNPHDWLFVDGKITEEDPSYTFSRKMEELGYGNESIFNEDGELGDAVSRLISRAQELAFAAGFAAQGNPELLVFEASVNGESECQ